MNANAAVIEHALNTSMPSRMPNTFGLASAEGETTKPISAMTASTTSGKPRGVFNASDPPRIHRRAWNAAMTSSAMSAERRRCVRKQQKGCGGRHDEPQVSSLRSDGQLGFSSLVARLDRLGFRPFHPTGRETIVEEHGRHRQEQTDRQTNGDVFLAWVN